MKMSKARIMVVDDESILRMDIKEMLIEAGYDVVAEANTGELAIELAALHRPDLIVMDVKMPKMNGIKASKIIQQSFKIPVLLLTAYSETDLIKEARNANVVGYLVKPISEQDLIPAVEVALGQSERIKALLGNIQELEYKMETRKLVEKAKGILMEIYKISEEDAYKKIRSYCMTNRTSMKEVAEYVIKHRQLDSRRVSSLNLR
jgi:AmiR/NasT family two-component response regulator